MPRVCTICSHLAREDINKALLFGEPFRLIATRTGTSAVSLMRHKTDHLPVHLAQAQEAREVAQADA